MIDLSKRRTHLILVILVYISFVIQYGVYLVSTQFIDLPSFYNAANLVFVENLSPYGSLVAPSLKQISSDQVIFPFLLPPPTLLLLYPYSLMTYTTAALITLIVNHLLILFFVFLFLFKILHLDLNGPFLALAGVYVFLYHPLVITLNNGQINLFVLVFLCLTWYTLKRSAPPAIIALPLALATILKVYPGIFLFYLLAKRKYRLVFWFFLYLTLFVFAAAVLFPRDVWNDWFSKVLPSGGYGQAPLNLFSPAGPWNQSINGFISRLFLPNEFSDVIISGPSVAILAPYVMSFIVILVTFLLVYFVSKHRFDDNLIDLEFSLVTLTMYLVAPISWEHHLVFVLPAAIIALHRLVKLEKISALYIIAVLSVLLLAWRYPHWANILKQGIFTLGISAKFYAVVTLWFFFAIQIWKHIRLFAPAQQLVTQTKTV